jgi:hypothetical protein
MTFQIFRQLLYRYTIDTRLAFIEDHLFYLHIFQMAANANIQRWPLRIEAKKRSSGGGPSGPERTGMTG